MLFLNYPIEAIDQNQIRFSPFQHKGLQNEGQAPPSISVLSPCKQLENLYLIPIRKDMIARDNLTVDDEIGLFALEGEVLIFLNEDSRKLINGRALGDFQNLLLDA